MEQNVKRSLQKAERVYILRTERAVLSGTPAELREEDQVKKVSLGIEVSFR